MNEKPIPIALAVTATALFCALLLVSNRVFAHCDTMDGPVVKTAQLALEKGDVTPVLKWVHKENEEAIREAFKKTLAVRELGKQAGELADMYFFETLVRLHRAGEGASYTGIKPAGAPLEPGVAEADRALDSGRVDELAATVLAGIAEGIKDKFNKAMESKKHEDESVDAGREYVEAYVTYVHYIEQLKADAEGGGGEEH